MSIENVKAYFRPLGLEGRIQEFPVSSATVGLAAQALGCQPGRIAKTLSFLVEGQAVLIVMAGDKKVDNPKYKAQFGAKAKRIPQALPNRLPGLRQFQQRHRAYPKRAGNLRAQRRLDRRRQRYLAHPTRPALFAGGGFCLSLPQSRTFAKKPPAPAGNLCVN